MAANRSKSVQEDMNYKRNGDKQISVNLLISILSLIILLVGTYVIGTMTSRIDRIENKVDAQIKNVYEFSQHCKEEINEVRKELLAKIKRKE